MCFRVSLSFNQKQFWGGGHSLGMVNEGFSAVSSQVSLSWCRGGFKKKWDERWWWSELWMVEWVGCITRLKKKKKPSPESFQTRKATKPTPKQKTNNQTKPPKPKEPKNKRNKIKLKWRSVMELLKELDGMGCAWMHTGGPQPILLQGCPPTSTPLMQGKERGMGWVWRRAI